jgi:hypothetical protein
MSYKVHPLKILRYKAYAILPFFILSPYLLSIISSGWQLFVIQSYVMFFAMTAAPAMPIFIKIFPVFRRFTYTSFIYALTRALMYVITSFGLVYLTEYFHHWGVALMMVPSGLAFLWGVFYFEKKEQDMHPKINIPKQPLAA